MHKGYVKFYRKSLNNPLFIKPLIWHFWQYCLLKANHTNKVINFNGTPIDIKRGSFVMSIRNAAKETGLTERGIRTAINNLVNHKMIEKSTHELTQQATMIKVLNYELYQKIEIETDTVNDTAPTQHRHSTDTAPTHTNNIKNDKNEKRIGKSKKEKIKTFNSDCIEMKISRFLVNILRRSEPKLKDPNWQSWCKEIDKLLRIDKRTPSEIKEVILFAHNPKNSTAKFSWIPNLRSPVTLRSKFTKIQLEIKNKQYHHAKTEDETMNVLAALHEDSKKYLE